MQLTQISGKVHYETVRCLYIFWIDSLYEQKLTLHYIWYYVGMYYMLYFMKYNISGLGQGCSWWYVVGCLPAERFFLSVLNMKTDEIWKKLNQQFDWLLRNPRQLIATLLTAFRF